MHTCSQCGHLDPEEVPRKLCQASNAECCDACQRLDDLNREIGQARALLRGLLEKRKGLGVDLNRAHPSIVDRLPTEVASDIFIWYAADRAHVPLVLGAICENWRRIAWSTPGIWTSPKMDLFRKSSWEVRIRLTKEWMGRSGRLPLSITWHETSREISDFGPNQQLIDLINLHANRWEYLDMSLPPLLISGLKDSAITGSPRLRGLTLHSNWVDGLAIHSISRLQPEFVKSRSNCIPLSDLDWSIATQVTIRMPSANEALQMLQLAPCLQDYTFKVFEETFVPPFAGAAQMTHTSLSSLDFCLEPGGPINRFFDCVTLPALERLCVRVPYKTLDVSSVTSFLSRSQPVLKHLAFEELFFTDEGFIPIARLLPSLETLHIKLFGGGYSNQFDLRPFFLALASLSSGEALLPILQEFKWEGDWSFTWDVLAEFLEFNFSNDPPRQRPLKSITVLCDDPDYDTTPRYIRKDILSQLSAYTDRVNLHFKGCIDGEMQDLWIASLAREE